MYEMEQRNTLPLGENLVFQVCMQIKLVQGAFLGAASTVCRGIPHENVKFGGKWKGVYSVPVSKRITGFEPRFNYTLKM